MPFEPERLFPYEIHVVHASVVSTLAMTGSGGQRTYQIVDLPFKVVPELGES